jgi:hypothetical protein
MFPAWLDTMAKKVQSQERVMSLLLRSIRYTESKDVRKNIGWLQ